MDFSIISKIARDCFRQDRIHYPQAKILTIAHDNDRSLLHQGRWYSPLIDTFEDDLGRYGIKCVSISRVISRIKGELAYGHVFSPEGAFARALVAKRLRRFITSADYPYSYSEEAIWGNILDQTGARKVFGILPSRELCVACHKRGIWVADVQHGVISDSHPWYGQRFRGHDPEEYLPHAFLCWDLGSQQVINRWAVAKGVSTVVTGNRWVARFLRHNEDDELANNLFRAYMANNVNPTNKPAILVSLSWGCTNIPNGFMTDALLNIIRTTTNRYHWSVRLHPNQLNGFATNEGRNFIKYFRNKIKGLVEFDLASRSALPLVLRHSNLHIAWNSSVSIEAAQMGIRSALLDPRFRSSTKFGDYYEYYRQKGMIDFVEGDELSISSWIDANLNTKAAPESFNAFDDAYQNLIKFLAE